ncbi:phosphotransferase family protein [Bacillus suaedaesalsae]|uniref:Phosphotransferase family protein n=1 Tax=Bacillus suaedaesalsae TaxID=2810349 RepID=A0ABS2DJ18_9BACI|nr:phosphotransferase family protein [Bacillus suaedaesalsae]MBM6617546.1 phosphotransferase family protein [Bacillus suaedaesalsae]
MNQLNEFKDTIPVRKEEQLNEERLLEFLHSHFELNNDQLEIRQFGAGHSNLTYEIKVGNWEAVLRRPPLGPVAPKAHDMEREHSILRDLHSLFPFAPKPYAFSNDESIVGSQFYIMERKRGFVYDTSFPKEIVINDEFYRAISEEMVDTLVTLHEVDYNGTKLQELSHPVGFLERQVHGWIGRYVRAKTDDIKGVEELTTWLATNIPISPNSTIIHYDYKLNNAMFSFDSPTKMVGLFDWEMTTIGDPLADVGAALSYWIQDDDPELLKLGLGKQSVTATKGFYSRKEFVERYARKSGRDLANIDYYITFAYFKLATICQQIYYRYKQGQTNDPRFANFHIFVSTLITHALQSRKGS